MVGHPLCLSEKAVSEKATIKPFVGVSDKATIKPFVTSHAIKATMTRRGKQELASSRASTGAASVQATGAARVS